MKSGDYIKSSLDEKIRNIHKEYDYQLTIAELQHQAQLEKIKATVGMVSIAEQAKSIIKTLQDKPELLDEFNRQMRALKLEQIKNSKK